MSIDIDFPPLISRVDVYQYHNVFCNIYCLLGSPVSFIFFVYKISYPYVAKREICSAFDIELAVLKMLMNCFNKNQYHLDRLDPNTSTIASLTYIWNIQIQIRREHR